VCTGAVLLATAGVLDGRRAATHWSVCSELARRFPSVQVQPDPIFVHDGPAWTSAGVTAGIDLALALVEEDLGRSVALAVARYLVVFLKRPGGQAQFSAALALQDDGRFDTLHSWIGVHLSGDLSLARLADQAGMSERSFSRHYLEATGQTPARAIETLRVEAARSLLLDSQLPVKRIAQRCGFGSEETMRRSFLRLLAATRKSIALGSGFDGRRREKSTSAADMDFPFRYSSEPSDRIAPVYGKSAAAHVRACPTPYPFLPVPCVAVSA